MTKLNYKHSTTICSETRVNVGENILKSQDTSTQDTQHKTTAQTDQCNSSCCQMFQKRPSGTEQTEDR